MASLPAVHAEPISIDSKGPHWTFATRLAFRFSLLYFGPYILSTGVVDDLLPFNLRIPALGSLPPIRPIVLWTAAHIFHAPGPLTYKVTGSGDRAFDWILAFCVLAAAWLATGVWTILDRKRTNYIALNKWFRLFIRLSLGAELVSYGLVKLVPLQRYKYT